MLLIKTIIFLLLVVSATENFRLGVGYRQQTGTSIGTDFESVNGSIYYKKVAGKVTLETNNRVSNAIQNGIHEGTAHILVLLR